jgi:probable metal-binding protein
VPGILRILALMDTVENVHGHEVLRLVGEAEVPLTRGELEAEMVRRFGEGARFCTCSAGDMTREELLGFLMERGKLVEREGRMEIVRERICE